MSDLRPFRIGMIGAGTVGGGVYQLIMNGSGSDSSSPQQQRPMVITKLLVRSLDQIRDFDIYTDVTTVTTDPTVLFCNDNNNSNDDDDDDSLKEMDCFVEVAGGCGIAKDLMLQALQYGIPVITANKAALFEYNTELRQAAASSDASRIGMEAAVCGGIPIIHMLQTAYVSDRITSICGICNGTTNYMLSKMEQNPTQVRYADALQEAQSLGYAEADPTADVEGHDVRAKIALLAQLAFGTQIHKDMIPCTGITQITADDFFVLKEHYNGSTIKLLGRAMVTMDDQDTTTTTTTTGTVCVYVTPTVIPATSSLAQVQGCGNAVQVTSINLDICTYMGPGAGRLPTANSIVADIYRAVQNTLPVTPFAIPSSYTDIQLTIAPDYVSRFYVRVTASTGTAGTQNDLEHSFRKVLGELGIVATASICASSSVVNCSNNTYIAVTTEPYRLSVIRNFCDVLQQQLQATIVDHPLCMPILE
jgi:homoserine dehydrogenase